MKPSFYRRYGLLVLLFTAAWLPAIVIGAKRAADSNENIVADWLPEHFEETEQLKWFISRFGTAEMLVISWEGCTLVDPRAEELARALRRSVKIDGKLAGPLFRSVFTGSEMLNKLMAPPFDLKRSRALHRLEGWLVGSDGRQTCVVAQLSEVGRQYRHEAVDLVYQSAQSACQLKPDEIHVAGPSIDSVAIDRTSNDSIRTWNLLCWGSCLLLAILTLRSLRVGFIMFFVALVCQYMSVAIVYYTGATMNSILMMVASLVFVLSVSAGVHMVNYYRDAIAIDGLAGAAGRAVRFAWVPCWLAATTTSLGMASLAISGIRPIHMFGIYSAVGVLAGLALLMFVLPSWLELWPDRRWVSRVTPESAASLDGGRWRFWADNVIRWHKAITWVGITLLILIGYGVTNIQTTVNLHDMFVSDAPVIRDYEWIQEKIGPLIPVDVVLHIPIADEAGILERMQLVEGIRRQIAEVEFVGGTLTAATFGPKVPYGSSIGDTLRRTVLRRRLERHRDDFQRLKFLYIDGEDELWRISVRAVAQTNIDYGDFLDQLKLRVRPELERQSRQEDGIEGVRATFSGGIPLVNKAQNQLLEDLIWSFGAAFVLVGLVMMVVLRDPIGGALSMIPNLIPGAFAFGMMGWMGIVVDIGAMMTASAALGIAVDDTLHFIVWFRRGLKAGYDRKMAVRHAFQRCGTAMTQTSLICGLGLLAYSFSPFVPISRFSWLMFLMLSTALLGDLILLPALLTGPLGRFFEFKKNAQLSTPPRPSPRRAGDVIHDANIST